MSKKYNRKPPVSHGDSLRELADGFFAIGIMPTDTREEYLEALRKRRENVPEGYRLVFRHELEDARLRAAKLGFGFDDKVELPLDNRGVAIEQIVQKGVEDILAGDDPVKFRQVCAAFDWKTETYYLTGAEMRQILERDYTVAQEFNNGNPEAMK